MWKHFFTPKAIALQFVVLLVLGGIVEFGARQVEYKFQKPTVQLELYAQPYVMFGAGSGDGFTWLNIFTKKQIPSSIKFNNMGFSETFDFQMVPDAQYLAKVGKKPGEKIVLLTGGSVVHGVGATSNANTISAQMERYLNAHSTDGKHYRVINIGMGSWIAYQQFIGLSLYGLPLNPDWVVCMDGHNDAAVGCVHGCGVGNPLGWPQLLNLVQGGSDGQKSQKTGILQSMAQKSAFVRILTGIRNTGPRPSSRDIVFDNSEPDPRFRTKIAGITVELQDQQLEFYLQAQRNVMSLFKGANIIMSLQPLMYDNAITPAYRTALDPKGNPSDLPKLKSALDKYMQAHGADKGGGQVASQLLGYFMARSAIKLKELVDTEQALDPSRKIIFTNVEFAMPLPEELRKPFFIDNAHMSDLGQERCGELFADIILKAEKSVKFDYGDFIDRHTK